MGAAAFWVPDLIVHHFHLETPTGLEILLPLTTAAAFCISGIFRHASGSRLLSPRMLLGIWLCGPLYQLVSGILERPEQMSGMALLLLLASTLVFPMTTFIAATYDMTLLALFYASGGLVLLFVLDFAFVRVRRLARKESV